MQPLFLAGQLDHPRKTASDKPEEGEDDVKSACPLCSGLHTCCNGKDKGWLVCKNVLVPKTLSKFRLEAVICFHEAGIASNRWSAIQR